jgi:hypothetical protein
MLYVYSSISLSFHTNYKRIHLFFYLISLEERITVQIQLKHISVSEFEVQCMLCECLLHDSF